MSSTKNPVASTGASFLPPEKDGSRKPPECIDALDPGESVAPIHCGFYDRISTHTTVIKSEAYPLGNGQVIDDLPSNHLRLHFSAPPTPPTDPKRQPVHFPLAFLYQFSAALKNTHSQASLRISSTPSAIGPLIHDTQTTPIPLVATDLALFHPSTDDHAAAVVQQYIFCCTRNEKTDSLSGFITLVCDVSLTELRRNPNTKNATPFDRWIRDNGIKIHESTLYDSNIVLAGIILGVIPREPSGSDIANDLKILMETQDPNHSTRMIPEIRIDAVARTEYIGRQVSGRVYAIYTEPQMKDDVTRLLEDCPNIQMQPVGKHSFGRMFFISTNEWYALGTTRTTTTSTQFLKTGTSTTNNNKKTKRITQMKTTSDRSALLQQQTSDMDQFRDISIECEVCLDPWELTTTDKEYPTLIEYISNLLSGDDTYLFSYLSYSPSTKLITFYCTVAHLRVGSNYLSPKWAVS
jgi:hypothetical protein